jgi:hypothetical protein
MKRLVAVITRLWKEDCIRRLVCLGGAVAWARLRGHRIVLLHIGCRGQEAYIEPVIREVASRGMRVSLFLFADSRAYPMDIAAVSEAAGISRKRVLNWDTMRLLRPFLGSIDAYITPTQWSASPVSARLRICMFHGQPTKGNTFTPKLMAPFNTLFILGPLQRSLYEEFAAANPESASGTRTFSIGYPKSDALINRCYEKSATLAKLGLSSGTPSVLFAPAYDQGTSLDLYGESIIEELLRSGANVIVKLHPMQYNPPYDPSGINWSERLRVFERHERFRHVGNQPLDAFLEASEVLVTDVSGAAFEFMLLDKPVVFIDCPSFFNTTLGCGHYVRSGEEVMKDIRGNAGRSAGLVVPDPSHLPEAIRRSLLFPGEFSSQRQAVREQLLYHPGKAAAAAADTLFELLNASSRRKECGNASLRPGSSRDARAPQVGAIPDPLTQTR